MIKTLHEILKASPDMTYNEAVKVQEDMRSAIEAKVAGEKEVGACITAGMKRDQKAMEKMKKEREIKNKSLGMKEAQATIKKLEIENDLLRDKLQVKELQTTTNN